MKKIFYLLFLVIFVFTGCKVDKIESNNDATSTGGLEVSLDKIETVAFNDATVKAQINNTMSREIHECGVLYSDVPFFSLGQAKKIKAESFGETDFSVNINGLTDGVTYYFRFYVNHSAGVSMSSLSEDSKFVTPLNYRVPELLILSPESINERQIEAEVVHDGHYTLTEFGAYYSVMSDMSNSVKIVANTVEQEDGVWKYVVDLPTEDIIPQNSTFYCQAYSINEKGEGRSEIKEIKLERAKQYPSFEIIQVKIISKTEAELSAKVLSQGYDAITEYGYYINGSKVKVGDAIAEGETFTAIISGLTMGKDNTLYPYGINSDGETKQPAELYTFYTGIPDKFDPSIVYLELPAIEKDGKKYYFLDRNLGARAAYETGDGPTDMQEAGWVFQWGRNADGHQLWSSKVKAITAPIDVYPIPEEYVGFYLSNKSSYDWIGKITEPPYTTLWDNSPSGGINNPCPEGYRVPTRDELKILFENKDKLKVVNPGIFRAASDGTKRTGNACYWSCEVNQTKGKVSAYQYVIPTAAVAENSSSGQGNFIRAVRVE